MWEIILSSGSRAGLTHCVASCSAQNDGTGFPFRNFSKKLYPDKQEMSNYLAAFHAECDAPPSHCPLSSFHHFTKLMRPW